MKLVKLLGGALATCAIVSTAHAGQWKEGSIAGFNNAFTYVPDTYAPRASDGSTDKRSLVIHLVGCGQTAEQAKQSAGWEMAAEAYGMIVVIPEPMKPVHPNKAAPAVECFDYGYNSDFSTNTLPTKSYKDHAAIMAAPAKMQQVYSEIDLEQVYVTGLSAGAAVAMEVACMAPDVFAGVGEAAGPAWDTRQQQAVAAVNGGGMVSKQTDPAEMKNTCLSWAGNKASSLKNQIWAIVSDDNFLPIGGLSTKFDMDKMETVYGFTIFDDGSVWDGDKFTPTAYHDYVSEVMQDLILDNAGTKTEAVLATSEEHGQGAGCSAEAADFKWDGKTDGASGVDYSSVQCLPKDAVFRDWEAKAEIWSNSTGHKQLVRIQQDTLKHSWPIGSENRAQWVDECVGTGGITVDQIYNPQNPKYSQLKDSDGMWKVDVVEDLPHGAIGCIYHNYRSINFPMYLGKLWNNNNPALGAAIDGEEECEDLNGNGICDIDEEEECEDLNGNGICDIDEEEECEDLNGNGICDVDEEEECEDLNGNGICDVDEEEECEDLNGNGICDIDEEEADGLDIGDVQVEVMAESHKVVFTVAVEAGESPITQVRGQLTNSAGLSLGTFDFEYDAEAQAYVLGLGIYADGSTYKLNIVATDEDGDTDSEEVVFKMGQNEGENVPPVVSGFAGNKQGDNCVVFSGTATDTDGSVANVAVRVAGIGTQSATVNGDAFSAKVCNLEAGTYTATAVATDNEGAQSNKLAATATIEGSIDGGEAQEEKATFYEHWSAGRISGSMWAPTEQYTAMKNKYCATSWFTMFCTTEITLRRCSDDQEWTDGDVTCEGGVVLKKADVAVDSADLGTINTDTPFVLQPTVTNNGPDAAGAVSLTVVIQSGIDIKVDQIDADCELNTNVLDCALGTIANGASKTVAIPATSSTEGQFSASVTATTAQKDEVATNNAGVISGVIGKVIPDEEDPVIASITLTPASKVEEGKSVKVTVMASDNKGVTTGAVNNVAGGKLCTLARTAGVATAGTFECTFNAPDVDADLMLTIEASVSDAAGNSADSDLAHITVTNIIDDGWTSPAPKAFHQVTNYGENSKNENGKTHTSGIKMYLHIPADLPKNAPIVMAMHGCQQTATGFRTDTGWTDLADKYKFYVIFPEMYKPYSTSESSSDHVGNEYGCFNWAGYYGHSFGRDIGDAASLMQMIRYIQDSEAYQGGDVYVTGLSAGGGMTSAMGAFYPDEIKAIAPMSGPVFGCATFEANGSKTRLGTTTKNSAFACQGITSSFSPRSGSGCTSGIACMDPVKKRDTDMWAQHVTDMGPSDYAGPYPKTLIWSGTKDQLVDPISVDYHAKQWTKVHATTMNTTNDVKTIKDGGREHVFNEYSKGGEPVVATVMIKDMGHGIATDPGNGEDQGGAGSTSDCYGLFCQWKTDVDIHSSYYTAKWWGLID